MPRQRLERQEERGNTKRKRSVLLATIGVMALLSLLCSVFSGEHALAGAVDAVSQDPSEWPMAGGNPQRTSRTPEEIRGRLSPAWYRPIEPYIPAKVQIVAANGLLYVSTARGLYALDAETGEIAWIYPTQLPLGHSPTIYSGRAYVGGLDHKIHAVNALTGALLWTFETKPDGIGAGFSTNPLVLDLDGQTMIFAGNRDGWMYAVRDDGAQPTLIWSFQTGGPILLSAAYQGGTIYFASNDSYAYALNARTGQLVWRSAKLPSAGFHSWWPVVAGDAVIFPATRAYRFFIPPQTPPDPLANDDPPYAPPMGSVLPDGTMDATQALQYLEERPWRRVYYVLDTQTGQEITFDFDQDGMPEYAPFLKVGTNSGTVYPAVVAADGTIFTFNNYDADDYGQGPAGWALGAESIIPTTGMTASAEPLAFVIGGDVIYWNQCCDRTAGAFALDSRDKWNYFSYDLDTLCPGYDVMMMGTFEANAVQVYGGWNGVYGSHGDQNPPIPYQGRVYMHRGNAVIAWSVDGDAISLPLAGEVAASESPVQASSAVLQQRLGEEVQKILDAGHLRPGLGVSGAFCEAAHDGIGDHLCDYWHSPIDTILALSLAVPHLPAAMQQQVLAYLQVEIDGYMDFTTVGWRDGAGREAFDLPPEIQADLPNYGPSMWSTWGFEGWTGPDEKWVPHTFYALWKYAEVLDDPQAAKALFDTYHSRLWSPPSDEILIRLPFVHNAWIAGYWGYLELERLAGYPESADIRAELDRLLALRASSFEKDNSWGPDSHNWGQDFAVARNFVFLTPELGQFLHDHILGEVQTAFDEYNRVAPYWFVTNFEASYNENILQHLYDYDGMFAAAAFVLQRPREELVKYLDVPAFARGDLFYLQNLVAAIEAPPALDKSASPRSGHQGEPITYGLTFLGSGITLTLTDTVPVGVSAPGSFELEGTNVTPVYDSAQRRLTWTDTPPPGQEVTIRYTVVITTGESVALVNIAELSESGSAPSTDTAIVMANCYPQYLPLIQKR
jgi:hypothetical protein